ncbi:MAG TPA: aldehyde dehydrogenase family protein [Verrucomicrobiales bacterium]|nr:aldehyde dehydrogenase family protein [Verrucomicrobiales bacterium]
MPSSPSPSAATAIVRLTSPFDGREIAAVPSDTPAGIEGKLSAARAVARAWRLVSLRERIVRVEAVLAGIAGDEEEAAREISLQMGKPLAQARGEVRTFLARARQSLADAPAALMPEVLEDSTEWHRAIMQEPKGVVLIVAAWNYPLLIVVNSLVPALLSGNAVLLKHAAMTTLTGARIAGWFEGLGIPGLVQQVVTGHEGIARMIGDARVDHVAFTGSVRGGREISRAAGERFIEAGLELGGKDAAYVAADADLTKAVENLVDGACYNAGQSCCGIERVYVHASLYDAFVERAIPLMQAYVAGDPLADGTTLGPMARASALDELDAQMADAVHQGAKVLTGGRREGPFYLPTLVTGAPQTSEIVQEENFGPLLPVIKVADDAEAVRLMNDNRYGLTASVWTSDVERTARMAGELNAGVVFQNRCDFIDPALPWSGWGDSGRGSTLSRHGFYALTRRKGLHFRRQ